jgi:ribosomal protein S18 acetylase RimI-like enzyme
MSADGALTIRPYAAADHDAVVALWREVFAGDPPWNDPEDVITRKLGVQPDLFLVAHLGERMAGTVLGGFDGVRGWVHHLAVAPDLRRRGLAGRLMDRVEARLVEMGCAKLNLHVRRSNLEVVAFYESRGYAPDEVVALGKPLGRWRRDPH